MIPYYLKSHKLPRDALHNRAVGRQQYTKKRWVFWSKNQLPVEGGKLLGGGWMDRGAEKGTWQEVKRYGHDYSHCSLRQKLW